MNWLKHKYKVAKAVAIVTYKEWSAYRTHSMVSILVGPVYFVIQYFIWKAVFGGNDEVISETVINGMTFEQMLRYYGAATLINYLIMDFADWNLQMLIRTGKFLTFSLRPIHHRFFAFSQKLGHRVLGFLFEFVPCFIILHFIFGVNMVPERIGYTIISVALAFLMNFYVNYCLGMTAFYFVQSSGIRQVYQAIAGICSGTLIPLVFFPDIVQKLLFFMPFQYVTYIPICVYSGEYSLGGISMEIPQIIGIQAIAVVIIFIFSEILYRNAIKKYISVGG
ncbi:MAG: hypothetical protein E7266_08160 [Lachnospiraceae bacterium]|nr:hypothetical protein [Lachnospiraceae bacterium]